MSFTEEQVEEEWDGEWYDENGQLVAEGEYEWNENGESNEEDASQISQSSFGGEPQKEEDSVSIRTRITMEVLETERSYVDNILYVIEAYLKPIKARIDTPGQVLKATAFEKVFSNLEDLYEVNCKFLKQLEGRINESYDPETTTISDIFLACIPTFGPAYKPYLEHHQRTIDKLRVLDKKSSWQAFLQEVKERPDSRRGELSFFLIQPVQRCPRYELLLNQLIKHTPETHPDFKGLNKALEDSQELVISANEEMRKHEELKILHKIEGKWVNVPKTFKIAELGRKKVKEGNIYKVCRREAKRRFFILFNDVLLYGAHQASGSYKYSLHIDLANTKTRVQNLQDKGDLVNAFVIRSQEKSFTVYTDTPQEKSSWISSIEAILTSYGRPQGGGRSKGGSFLNAKGDAHQSVLVIEEDIDSEEAPVWIPDKDFNFCMICAVSFNTFRRKHHCRICGKLVCGSCSAQKAVLQNTHKNERICKICHGIKQLRQQQQQQQQQEEQQEEQNKAEALKKKQQGSTMGFNYFGGTATGSRQSFLRSSDGELPSARSSVIGGGSGSDDDKGEKEKKKKGSTLFLKKGSKKDLKDASVSSPQLNVKEIGVNSSPTLITTSAKVTAPITPANQPAIKMPMLPPGGLASLKSFSTNNLHNPNNSSAINNKARPNNAVNTLASKMMANNLSPNTNANGQQGGSSPSPSSLDKPRSPNLSSPSGSFLNLGQPREDKSKSSTMGGSFLGLNQSEKPKSPTVVNTGSFLNLKPPERPKSPSAPKSPTPETLQHNDASNNTTTNNNENVNNDDQTRERGRRVGPTAQPTTVVTPSSPNPASKSPPSLLGSGRPLPVPSTRSPSTSFAAGENVGPSRPNVVRSATSSGFGTGRPLPQVPK
eukprot:TRINITY_DN4582_c0_g1_i1.p1 TRINITY_DN4582_c0_g1~~TRINITY_DN4582_c0_g1_i1.p1  ORF type:complete len:882 (-),score=333.69 TRINITY_DN4582_c0_g1_i1:22-2667(-)